MEQGKYLHKKDGQLFWHLTDFSNMRSILQNGLLSRNKLIKYGLKFIDLSPNKLTKKRNNLGLDEYVPFHFFPWNPLDIAFFKENKKRNIINQEKFCYITIDRKIVDMLKAKFIVKYSNHDENINLLEYRECKIKIDNIGNHTDYSNGTEKLEALGECLIPDCVMYDKFYSIIVGNDKNKSDIELILQNITKENKCIVDVRHGYFEGI